MLTAGKSIFKYEVKIICTFLLYETHRWPCKIL